MSGEHPFGVVIPPDKGDANYCEHDDATGESTDWGPDMVWVCNGCGWRHRIVRDGHFSRMVAA